MTNNHTNLPRGRQEQWLTRYYFIRAGFSAVWVGAALTAAQHTPTLAVILLVGYPAWDAVANAVDAACNGGLLKNHSQTFNFAVSAAAAAGVATTLGNMNAVLGVFGAWAVFSGLLQLATAVRRWKTYGAQWAMILSGAQSALAGVFFVKMAGSAATVGIATITPYAAFGAFYFLISAIWLVVSGARERRGRPA